MDKEPIIIVGGEPNSVFLEIFFKSLKTNTYKSPLIIIISKKLLQKQMKKLDFDFTINDIDKKLKDFFETGPLINFDKLFCFIKFKAILKVSSMYLFDLLVIFSKHFLNL